MQSVPKVIWLSLPLLLALQISLRLPTAEAQPEGLPHVPSKAVMQSLFLGDDVLAGRLLMLWLQARDTQSGALIINAQRDYQRLSQWLALLNQLDPHSHYPLLLAGRVYSQSRSPQHIRMMLDSVDQMFKQSPERFWRWQLEAVVLAKHRLQDKSLALRYMNSLLELTPAGVLPAWVWNMRVVL